MPDKMVYCVQLPLPPFIKWGKPEEILQTTPILEILRNPS